MSETLNSVTNKLIDKYDTKYNNLVVGATDLESSIMNKEELIVKENELSNQKDFYIRNLIWGMLFAFLFMIIFIALGMKKISMGMFIFGLIVLIIIYSIIYYYPIYIAKLQDKKQLFLKSLAENEYSDENNYKCPSGTKYIGSNNLSGVDEVDFDQLSSYNMPVTTDMNSQYNLWKFGRLPADLYTTDQNYNKLYEKFENMPIYRHNDGMGPTSGDINTNRTNGVQIDSELLYTPPDKYVYPQQQIRSISAGGTKFSTYYKCRWNGDSNSINQKLPFPHDKQGTITTEKYSSIPCNHLPNYELEKRYICNQEPISTNIDGLVANKSCQEI